MNKLRDAYLLLTDSDQSNDALAYDLIDPELFGLFPSASQVLSYKDRFKNQLDISVIITAVLYVLNIVDASVDGHFYNYDISDDLSMQVKPFLRPVNSYNFTGLTLSFSL